ncbi:MAG TPA: energy-coupling factor transporter ATPase [Chloroflexota bacterium]|nr:energy-coupling factor transporter ATPase [Chloroflexota bacterium]
MASSVLRYDRFSWRFETNRAWVLDDVSLDVGPGEIVGVVGRSGCGKSTLLLAATGIVPHSYVGRSKGAVVTFGRDTAQARPADLCDRVAMVFQSPDDQISQLNVWREVGFGPANQRQPPDEVRRRIDEALELVGIGDLRERETNALSGGQKQKVALAAALAMHPRLLILDEPTTDLDPVSRQEVLAVVERLRDRHDLAIVVVSHEVDLISGLAERFALVDGGRIAHDESADRFFLDLPALREAGLELPQVAELNALLHDDDPSWPRTHRYADTLRALDERLATRPLRGGDGTAWRAYRVVPDPPAPLGPPLIELDRASFTYPMAPRPAIEDVSLTIRQGEFVAVIGANGSGKTTLTKLILGLVEPTLGRVLVGGRPLRKKDPDRVGRVGYVFQNPDEMLFNPTVAEEVEFGLKVRGDPKPQRDARVAEVLEQLELAGLRNRHPLALSKGQRQRLAYAAVLAPDPPVLIFDEPTTGLDYGSCEAIMAAVEELNRAGRTILFVTHDINLVIRHAHRIVVMGGGRVQFDGTPRALMALGPDRLADLRLVPPAANLLAHRARAGLPGDVLTPLELYLAVRHALRASAVAAP